MRGKKDLAKSRFQKRLRVEVQKILQLLESARQTRRHARWLVALDRGAVRHKSGTRFGAYSRSRPYGRRINP
jgi:hypothetical protein